MLQAIEDQRLASRTPQGYAIRALNGSQSGIDVGSLTRQIMALEALIFEPARREPEQRVRLSLTLDDAVSHGAFTQDESKRLIGVALGLPLEHISELVGPDSDSMLGLNNTLYSVAISVHPDFRRRGIGRALKQAQLDAARERLDDDGRKRYAHVSGRNRFGASDAMIALNRSLGATHLRDLDNPYALDENNVRAWYYRISV